MKKICSIVFLLLIPIHLHGQSVDSSYVSSEKFDEAVHLLKNEINILSDSLYNFIDINNLLNARLQLNRQLVDSLQTLLSNADNNIALLNDEVTILRNEIESIDNSLANQTALLSKSNERIDSLSRSTNSELENTTEVLNSTRSELSGLENETESRFSEVTSNLSASIWVVSFGILFVLMFSFVGIWQLKGRFFKKHEELDKENKNLNTKIAEIEQTNKADPKMLEILNEKLSEMTSERMGEEIDHSLALASALEITRMRKRIDRLDADAKGLKSLKKALERLEDELNIKGYEIIDLEGKPYDDGLNLKADFVNDKNLEKGKEVITRTIKPQVNFQGKAIQLAHVQVSLGT